ncbi:MAG: hypothetical protein H7Z38_15020, partial [Rubrivivax sp.]|nr:hypothetical protein [Pyrinomonadaceae bacterium]
MKLRSLLFVPGDRPERMVKALASGADALILDLEDSVVPAKKAEARAAVRAFLCSCAGRSPERRLGETGLLPAQEHMRFFVRVNPLDSGLIDDDLAAILAGNPDGIVLPKAEGAASLAALDAKLDWAGADGCSILPVA